MRRLLLLSLLTFPAAAPAQEAAALEAGAPQMATQRYLLGRDAYLQNQLELAESEFRTAFDLFPKSPKLAFNLARVNERLNRPAEAVKWYRSYLKLAPEAADKAEVEQLIVTLEKRIEREMGQAVVTSQPSGAAVFIGEATESAGQTPLTLKMQPGQYAVRLEKEGFAPTVGTVQIQQGKAGALALKLEAVGGVVAPPVVRPVVVQDNTRTILAVTSLVLGAGGLIAGGVFAAQAADTAGTNNDAGDKEQYDALTDELGLQSTVMWIGFGTGAAFSALGLVLLMSDDGTTALAPTADGLVMRGRF